MPSLLARATGYKAGPPSSSPTRRLLQKSTVSLDAQTTNQVGTDLVSAPILFASLSVIRLLATTSRTVARLSLYDS